MADIIPLTLNGSHLGERYRYLNYLVSSVLEVDAEFEKIINLKESSPIDRIFKIDLASKLKDVDFIIKNLQDDDMLYVSRALKSKWLLDPKYQEVFNPEYLETHLYPNMITTAVTKMKHWIYINLKDANRNRCFYEYYCKDNFNYAVKFLVNCNNDFIIKEFPNIMQKVTPNYFKVLCEKCSEVAKIFFDALLYDETLKSVYLAQDHKYFEGLQVILKTDSELYLNITERYFVNNKFKRFSHIATKYIMQNCKEKFCLKSELYAAWLLNIKTMSTCLTVDECKELVFRLGKAKYLSSWFNYKAVEPLIKRIKPEERAAFKKIIFVERNLGDKVENWPYDIPSSPKLEDYGFDIFNDTTSIETMDFRAMLKKRKYAKWGNIAPSKTLLDKLFDAYRFCSFERTLYELRKRIKTESSPQNREYMMLVLVSKSGGRADALTSLLELLALHNNEPANVRAAVIRSLVKRAFVWRLPEDTWLNLVKFAQGLGLDGKPSDADCLEGLYAVVIRNLISKENCDPLVFKSFINNFSTLETFSLTTDEKKQISSNLPRVLINSVTDAESVNDKIKYIIKLIHVLTAYKIDIASYPNFISIIENIAREDYYASECLLWRLYKMKVARKELFYLNFNVVQVECSYLNALKHDPSVIDVKRFVDIHEDGMFRADTFLRKVKIYFGENSNLAYNILSEIQSRPPLKSYGCPLAILLQDKVISYTNKLDTNNIELKLLSSTIKSNLHLTRAVFELNSSNWIDLGPKFVSNGAMVCRQTEIENVIKNLLDWKRTLKVAFELSRRCKKEEVILGVVAKFRPTYAIKTGIKLLKNQNEPEKIWNIIKNPIAELDMVKMRKAHLEGVLNDIESLPSKIQPKCAVIMFKKYATIFDDGYKIGKLLTLIETFLSDVESCFIENLLSNFLEDFNVDNLTRHEETIYDKIPYIRILIKYLLLSKTEEIQQQKIEIFGKRLLFKMEDIFRNSKKFLCIEYLEDILFSLKYHVVYLNLDYVGCLPVMETVVNWMQENLQMEENFKWFVNIHLIMLYYKAVRQSTIVFPELFDGDKKKLRQRVELVGIKFGQNIAQEVNELIKKYFESIVDLYKVNLLSYLKSVFHCDKSKDFLISIVKGILEASSGIVTLLAIYIVENSNIKGNELVGIRENILKKAGLETQFFAFEMV